MFRAVLLGATLVLFPHGGRCQPIENVLVETYAVTAGLTDDSVPLTTYRIYIDLAPGHRLQMVYGDEHHTLRIASTSWFFNDTVNGAVFGDHIDPDDLNKLPSALDSWVTIGNASSTHQGIPRHLDRDGSILECPPYGLRATVGSTTREQDLAPLCAIDGLQRDTSVRQIVDFKFASGYFGKVRGDLLETNDGAWAALGGRKGITEENLVLIAQITTTGRLSYQLNVQVAGPDGAPVKVVASDATPGERLFEGLASPPLH